MLYPVELRGRFQILHLTRFIDFLWSDCSENGSDSLRTSLLHCAGDLKYVRLIGDVLPLSDLYHQGIRPRREGRGVVVYCSLL